MLLVSVIIVNYNSGGFLGPCLLSLRDQDNFKDFEVIVWDNASTDGSADSLPDWVKVIKHHTDIGYGPAINLAVVHAEGKYLFFLNPDTRLDRGCLKHLVTAAERTGAEIVSPVIFDYDSDKFQTCGASGFDCAGGVISAREGTAQPFMAVAMSLIRRWTFLCVGKYDAQMFLYGEELDLCWRVRAWGGMIIHTPEAKMQHKGDVTDNPQGLFQTSTDKRYYANRSHLITICKNAQHILLGLLGPAIALMVLEGIAGAIRLGQFRFFTRTVLEPLRDLYRLRSHIRYERVVMSTQRKVGDFSLLRFFSFKFARLRDYKKVITHGLPIIK